VVIFRAQHVRAVPFLLRASVLSVRLHGRVICLLEGEERTHSRAKKSWTILPHVFQRRTLSNTNGDEKPRSGLPSIPIRSAAPTSCEPDVGEEEDPHGEEGEDAIDPEVQRKEVLRARSAKLSHNIGMHGMFGQEDQREQRIQLASPSRGLTQEDRRTETGQAAVRVPDITADKTKESMSKEDIRKEYEDEGVQVDIRTDQTTGAPGRKMRGNNMQMGQFQSSTLQQKKATPLAINDQTIVKSAFLIRRWFQ
jgi:hypothetical protein